jgi:RNA polymerase sigma factor (sigma-70 family)
MRLVAKISRGFLRSFCFDDKIVNMVSNTRATLLERLRDGVNALAWDEFFACYWPTIYGFARHRGCSEHTAEEIVQNVMLKIFQQRDVFQYDPDRGRFRDWLGTVVRNDVAEHRRRPANRVQGRGGESGDNRLVEAAEPQDAEAAWESAFENSLLLALLDAVRRETNARTYLAFELIGLQGMSGGEAARMTGLTRNAAYKAHKRVLERLAELGAPYRREGRLLRQIKEALDKRAPAAVQRSLTARIQKTMCSR